MPKEKKPDSGVKATPYPTADHARFTPLVVDDDEIRTTGTGASPAPVPRYLGPAKIETAASPYVDVRVGIPETPGGNNHMRRQVALSSTGTVHMVYGVIAGFSTASDSDKNFLYFYNAYNCSGSGTLEFGSLDVQMAAPGPPADPRPRVMNQGGIFILPNT
ncbi:MAG: hypothetical protein L0209_10285, partial [candidate division Zixibacteria bacterium]|nr:hypothetical protein [candidate division Zixibacteria bacterium]